MATVSTKTHIKLNNRLIGLMAAINPFAIYDSSPRLGMLSNHITQAPTPLRPDIPLVLHGHEQQLKAYDIRMPEDGSIISIHNKYRQTLNANSIRSNPLTTIVYQNAHTGEIDCVHVYEFNTNHKNYGSRYILEPIMNQLSPGLFIKKDTLFARSPAKLAGDLYSTSVTCNVLAIGDPATIEDGFCVSDEFCERAGLLEIKTVHHSCGKNRYLLNVHGTKEHFKGIPDIGDVVGPDGILLAFRDYNPLIDALGMSDEALTLIDHNHDTKVHVDPGYIIYDVTVDSGIGETTAKPLSPPSMLAHANKYIHGQSTYYSELKQLYAKLSKDKSHPPLLSPRFTRLLTKAIADKPNDPSNKSNIGGRVRRARKGELFDELEITIKMYRPVPLGMGAKLTDFNGKNTV